MYAALSEEEWFWKADFTNPGWLSTERYDQLVCS